MSDENNQENKELAAKAVNETPVASEPAKKVTRTFALSEDYADNMAKAGVDTSNPYGPLMYAIEQATGVATKKAPQLAFTENPIPSDNYLGLFKSKRRLLPDDVLKTVRISDHLVAAILRARGSHLSLFGHLRKDRFDIGVEVEIKPEIYKVLTPEQFEKIADRMKRFEALLINCGHTEGLEQQQRMTLADFLDVQTRNGLTFGRFATEVIYDRSSDADADGKYPFHRFRPIDVATIYRVVRKGDTVGSGLREQAMQLLASLTGEKPNIDMNKLKEDEYAWLQVIEGQPRQAFTHDEMLVYNIFESTDVEHNGYPVSPLDTVVSSVTTHISIDAYKKLYFQNGRASKGMLVIKSDEVDEAILNNIKLQFNAAINNVSNSFRTPIFGMGREDEVEWVGMQGEGARDADFQFMYDQVARNILSAFSISPDELPGYAHLSRGTNSQTLSESNNEFKLTAARDTGLRPLILKFQTFFNQRLFPLIDPLLSKICEVKFAGLDAQSKEQESTRLQQDMPTHMTYDEVLHEVDKDPIGTGLGGKFPFNERWQLVADKMLNVSEVKGQLMDDPSAYVDPMLRYKRDPFFLQYLQLLAQVNPAAVQAYFAPRPHAMEFLKMCLEDSLEGEENV
jgi:hypothetical protein